MGWLIANGFLLLMVLIAAGYTWLAFFLLKSANLHEYSILVMLGFAAAIVATYYTARAVHAFIVRLGNIR